MESLGLSLIVCSMVVPLGVASGIAANTTVIVRPGVQRSFRYPVNASTYPNNAKSKWLFQAIPGYVVHLTFTDIDTEDSTSGCDDFIEVFDSISGTNLVDKVCGNQTNRQYYSTGQYMYVTVSSDDYVTRTGFDLTYEAVPLVTVYPDTRCSNIRLVAALGTEHFLKYPALHKNYTTNRSCRWLITTGNIIDVVRVTVLSVDIELSDDCQHDYLELFDGERYSYTSRTLGKFCGRQTQIELYSIGQSLLVTFYSNFAVSGSGFHLSYEAVRQSEALPATGVNQTSQYDDVCLSESRTRTVSLTPQYLKYPHAAFRYPNDAVCVWILQTTSYDYVVHVTFTFVDIEDSYDCLYDYVELHDGSSQLSSSLGRICGDRSRDFYSSGQYMYIRFKSDSSGSRSGFRLTYEAISRWNVPTSTVHSPYSPADIDLGFSKSANRASVIVASVIGVIFLTLTVLGIFMVVRQRRGAQLSRRHSPAVSRHPQSTAPSCSPSASAPSTFPPSVFDPPPAYNVVCPPGDSSNPAGGIPSLNSASPPTSEPPPAYSTLGFPLQASTNPARSPPPGVARQTPTSQGKDGHVNLSFSMEQAGPVSYSRASDASSVPDRLR